MWKIQELITQGACHATCSVTQPSTNKLHWAKLYTGALSWPEYEYFCRQASLGSLVNSAGLVSLADSILESGIQQPILVYPWLDAIPLNQWLSECPQVPAHSVLVWLMRQMVDALNTIHQAGMVHGHIATNHVLVLKSDFSARLVGLGGLEVIGAISSLPRHASRFDAPERLVDEFEVSTAADIYSAAIILVEVLGKQVEKSSLVQAMLASDPNQRPSANEVVELLLELERRMFGETISINRHKVHATHAA